MPRHRQIEKFAGEEIAFHLHKKRDFLLRLENHTKGKENTEQEKLELKEFVQRLKRENRAYELKNIKECKLRMKQVR